MLLLSSSGSLPGDLLGIYEIDLDSLEISPVQEWFNYDPFEQAPGLQGLGVGGGRHFILRSLYNDLQIFDAETLDFIESVSLPPSVPGNGWVLGGLTWRIDGAAGCAADINGDGALDVLDWVAFQGMMLAEDPGADCTGDGDHDVLDFVCFQGVFTAGCP